MRGSQGGSEAEEGRRCWRAQKAGQLHLPPRSFKGRPLQKKSGKKRKRRTNGCERRLASNRKKLSTLCSKDAHGHDTFGAVLPFSSPSLRPSSSFFFFQVVKIKKSSLSPFFSYGWIPSCGIYAAVGVSGAEGRRKEKEAKKKAERDSGVENRRRGRQERLGGWLEGRGGEGPTSPH